MKNVNRKQYARRAVSTGFFVIAAPLTGCDIGLPWRESKAPEVSKSVAVQKSFTKPIVRLGRTVEGGQTLFGIKDCEVYRATESNGVTSEWKLLFKPEFYPMPKTCIRERLEMEGDYLQIEIGTQAIGAGGCCTTYAAYRTKDGENWEIRPATSIKSWKPLQTKAEKTEAFSKRFVTRLSNQQPLAPLLRPTITFVFHSDNRCRGNTDGLLPKLPAAMIDSAFSIRVKNDGDAWECEKKDMSTFDMTFDLQQILASWERFEVVLEGASSSSFYVHGKGESDFLVVYVSELAGELLASRLEYRSEDPG